MSKMYNNTVAFVLASSLVLVFNC